MLFRARAGGFSFSLHEQRAHSWGAGAGKGIGIGIGIGELVIYRTSRGASRSGRADMVCVTCARQRPKWQFQVSCAGDTEYCINVFHHGGAERIADR